MTRALNGGMPAARLDNLAVFATVPAMPALTFNATFDGEHIRLSEPHALPKDARLLVTVLPPDDELAKERADWLRFSAQNLARAYGPDEPDYPDSCIKERNPLYDGR